MRRLEALNCALDSVNLIGNEKLRELSAVNGTLYEFLLAEEQKPAEEKVRRPRHHQGRHARLVATDAVADGLGLEPGFVLQPEFLRAGEQAAAEVWSQQSFSSKATRSFSRCRRRKASQGLAVSRACVLAREMVEIVRGYNELGTKAGLPPLELGVGISYQESAPLYLMDGEKRIMISEALNESDRLSSCNKRARKAMDPLKSPFHVYAFQTVSDADAGENAEDFMMSFNVGGIRMNEEAFNKLKVEISLEA